MKKKEYLLNPKRCPFCEETLPFSKRRNKFCNHSCAASFNNKGFDRYNNIRDKESNCLNCNTSLLSLGGKKYCSHRCQREFEWQNITLPSYLKKIKEGKKLNGNQIRKLVFRTREHVCCVCKNTVWNGGPIPLEVDHIDGNHKNNQLENLRLICPNCHAQTETYKGRNKGNGRKYRRERYQNGKSF